MTNFSSKPAYIKNKDGFLNRTRIQITAINIQDQNYTGADKESINLILEDIKSCQKQLDKMYKDAIDYQIELCSNKLF